MKTIKRYFYKEKPLFWKHILVWLRVTFDGKALHSTENATVFQQILILSSFFSGFCATAIFFNDYLSFLLGFPLHFFEFLIELSLFITTLDKSRLAV